MKVVGLISGTSADAIDAVVAEISGPVARTQLQQLAFQSRPWPPAERELIEGLIAGEGDTRALSRAGFLLGERFAEVAVGAIDSAGLAPTEVDLIGSHGQTVWHEVGQDGSVQSTLQIGEPAVIAERSGITTVADFRVADVAAGGQGAPLIPIFDHRFLRPGPDAGGCRALQNIGGIGNVTFLPPQGADATPLAFDTGPGNVLIDWARTAPSLTMSMEGWRPKASVTTNWSRAGSRIHTTDSHLQSRLGANCSAVHWPSDTARKLPRPG